MENLRMMREIGIKKVLNEKTKNFMNIFIVYYVY